MNRLWTRIITVTLFMMAQVAGLGAEHSAGGKRVVKPCQQKVCSCEVCCCQLHPTEPLPDPATPATVLQGIKLMPAGAPGVTLRWVFPPAITAAQSAASHAEPIRASLPLVLRLHGALLL